MNQLDPLLELEMHFHGSSREGTKVGQLDEFDCRLHITGLEKANFVIVEEEMKHNVILKINKDNENAVQRWGTFCDNNQYLVPVYLFRHIYTIMCKALVQTKKKKDMKNIKLYLKDVNNEQVHFEWVCSPDQGMPLKIDVVFVVTVTGWWPQKGIKDSKLLPKEAFHKTNILLRTNGWRPSSALQELMVMSNIPPIPKYAYIMCKIINNLVVYSKADSRNKVKTYHLKNALWILYESVKIDAGNPTLPMGPKVLKLWELNETHLEQIIVWTLAICNSGLPTIMAGKAFYFELSQSSLHEKQLLMFTRMVHFLLDRNDVSLLDSASYVGSQSLSRTSSDVALIDSDAKQCPRCGNDDLDGEFKGNFYNYRTCQECKTHFCWLCLQEVSLLHFITLSGCTIGGAEQWGRTKRIILRLLFLVGGPLIITFAAIVSIISIILGLPKLLVTGGSNIFSGGYEDLSSVTVLHVIKVGYEACGNWRSPSSLTTFAATSIASLIIAALVVVIGIPALFIHLYVIIPIYWTLTAYLETKDETRHVKTVKSKRKMKKCPACFFPNEKNHFNNVTCIECDADFCWLCGKEVYFLHFFWPSGCTYWGEKMWSHKEMLVCWWLLILTSPLSVIILAGMCIATVTIGFPMFMTHLHGMFADFSPLPTGIWAILVSPILGLITTATVVPFLLLCIFIVYPLYLSCKSYTGHKVVGNRSSRHTFRSPLDESKNKKACSSCGTINMKKGHNYINCFQCQHTFCWLCPQHDIGIMHFVPHTGCPLWGKMKWSFYSRLLCWIVMMFGIPSLLAGGICTCISLLICGLVNVFNKLKEWYKPIRVIMCLLMLGGPFAVVVILLLQIDSDCIETCNNYGQCTSDDCMNQTYIILIWFGACVAYWGVAFGFVMCLLENTILCVYVFIFTIVAGFFVTCLVSSAIVMYAVVIFPICLCISGIIVSCAQLQ